MSTLNIQLHRELGRLVQEHRKILGMSQEDLSQALKISRSSIANIERGGQKISVQTLYDLAQALRTEPMNLLPPPVPKPKKQPSLKKLLPQDAKKEKVFVQSILMKKGASHEQEGELGKAETPGGPNS